MFRFSTFLTCALVRPAKSLFRPHLGPPFVSLSSVLRGTPDSLSRPLSAFASVMPYTTEQRGGLHSPDYRLFFKDESGKPVSPFHDIPLQ